MLGALVDWKRPQFALEVAARMPDLQLTLAGAALPGDDGALEAQLRRDAERLGDRVTIAGPVDDVPAALADAHVLLHCAAAEPYGMVLVEALAAGRPVVAPAKAGPLEIVSDGAGRLYPPGNVKAAAQSPPRRPERSRGPRGGPPPRRGRVRRPRLGRPPGGRASVRDVSYDDGQVSLLDPACP